MEGINNRKINFGIVVLNCNGLVFDGQIQLTLYIVVHQYSINLRVYEFLYVTYAVGDE